MENFFENNKVAITNFFLILIIISSFVLKNYGYVTTAYYVKAMGCLGLTCSIINWLALQILLDKLCFLYTIDEIKKYFAPTKNLLINEIFGKKNFDILKKEYKAIITQEDKKNIENSINNLALNTILVSFQNDKVKNMIKESVLIKIYEIENAIKMKINNGLNEEEKQKSGIVFFKDEILPIIENKLEISVIAHIQLLIYNSIKNYFEWLVLWGAFSGMIFGLVFRFVGCL
ncbi:MAG TPA: hypothetical protein VLL98_05795 [Rickettsiales bacterium]|nr:hypothetical protein [Rickettsiales bacterium]